MVAMHLGEYREDSHVLGVCRSIQEREPALGSAHLRNDACCNLGVRAA
jgi:hypothetical protein